MKLIKLDDERFPCNAAYFRAAVLDDAMGSDLHTCFAPSAHCAGASLPYVTMFYSHDSGLPCATAPATASFTAPASSMPLPESDVVYGEDAAATAPATATTAAATATDTDAAAASSSSSSSSAAATAAAAAAEVVYPVGTVLMRARAPVPEQYPA